MSTLALLAICLSCHRGYGFVDVSVTNNTKTSLAALPDFFQGVLEKLTSFMFNGENSIDTMFDVTATDWKNAIACPHWERMQGPNVRDDSRGILRGEGQQYWSNIKYEDNAKTRNEIGLFWSSITPNAQAALRDYHDQAWISFANFPPFEGLIDQMEYISDLKAQWGSMSAAFTDLFNLDMSNKFRRVAVGLAYYSHHTCYPWHAHLAQEFYMDMTKEQQSEKVFERAQYGKDFHKDCGETKTVQYFAGENSLTFYQPRHCAHQMKTFLKTDPNTQVPFYGMYSWVFPEMSRAFELAWDPEIWNERTGYGDPAKRIGTSAQLEDDIIKANFYRFKGEDIGDLTKYRSTTCLLLSNHGAIKRMNSAPGQLEGH